MPIPKPAQAEQPLSAKQRVYQTLLQWIIDGTVTPGEKLNEAELAAHFSCSRTPVHEALMMLAEERFTVVYPARGSYAARIETADVDAVYEAITLLQCDIAEIACAKRTDGDLAALRAHNNAFARARDGGGIDDVIRADAALHARVAAAARNPYLEKVLAQLQNHVYRYEYILSRAGLDRSASVEDHRTLISAIERRDAAAARSATYENWMGQYRAQRSLLLNAIRQNSWGEKAE